MAQLVVAAAGAALGGFIAPGIVAFGMTGASLGWMAGSMIGSAFAPTQKSSGPQLSDLSVSTSAYGTPIPYVQGHPRISGQIVWASTKREIATTTEQGKGGGGSEYTSYTYEVDLLILLTDNVISSVRRVWSNGELIWSLAQDASEESIAASITTDKWARITTYPGTPDQLPDPTYEAAVGIASATAYRGRGSVFIQSLQLGSGGQLPNLTFEITASPGVMGEPGVVIRQFTDSAKYLNVPASDLVDRSSPEFDDSGWATGQGPFGNAPHINAPLTSIAPNTVGVFPFLTKFWTREFVNVSVASFLVIDVWADDIPTLYIDGQVVGLSQTSGPQAFRGSKLVYGGDYCVALMVQDTESLKTYSAFQISLFPALFDLDDVPVSVVVSDLCERSGLISSRFDVTPLAAITKPVRSMAISSVSSARTVIDMLAASYHFESVLSDKIYFRPRASAPAAALTFNELGVVVDSGSTPDPLPLTQANELEIPAQMALTYSNVDGDYQTDTQYSDRLLTGQESTSAMQVPLGFTSSEAKQIVDAMLLDKAVSALTTSVSMGLTRAALEPTDVVLLTGEDGSSYRMRVIKKAEASGVTTLECVQDDATVFVQTGVTSGGTVPQTTVAGTVATELEVLDIPLLRDVDNVPGHYVAVKGSAANWNSAGLYESLDNLTFTPNTTISSQAVIGTCTTTLGAWTGGNVFDEVSSVTVNVGTQQLASVTRDDILASQSTNAALIGAEVVQYRTATLVSAGVYTLSGFLRGQRGTASTGHAASERFVALASGGLRFVPLQQGDLGRLRYYKAASAGQRLSAVTSQSLTPAGITLKPFAPVDCRANRDTADTVLTWIRQTRLSTRIVGTLGISSPLGEAAESYEVEIYTAGHAALLRTLTSATPSVTYTSAQQVTDFGAGQSAIAVKIYQISATVGRGTPLITTV